MPFHHTPSFCIFSMSNSRGQYPISRLPNPASLKFALTAWIRNKNATLQVLVVHGGERGC